MINVTLLLLPYILLFFATKTGTVKQPNQMKCHPSQYFVG